MAQAHDTESPAACEPGTCVRCRERRATGPLALCPTCATATRVELAVGLRRLGEYLSNWAAFDAWCRKSGSGPACPI